MIINSIKLYLQSIILTFQTYFRKLFRNYDLKVYSTNDIKEIIQYINAGDNYRLEEIKRNIGRKVDQNDFPDKFHSNNNQAREVVLYNIFVYISQFLVKEHPLLGRRGPVCPFVPGSIKMQSIYFSVVEKKEIDALYVKKIILAYMKKFQRLKPTEGKLKVYKTMVIIFPNITLSEAPELIDGVQKQLKGQFINRGLMIGEFHLLNNSSGLRNPDFYPLRTPYPVLAIRHMVASDIAFMTPSDCEAKTQVSYLEGYIKNFEKNEHWEKQVGQAKNLLQAIMKKKQ